MSELEDRIAALELLIMERLAEDPPDTLIMLKERILGPLRQDVEATVPENERVARLQAGQTIEDAQ